MRILSPAFHTSYQYNLAAAMPEHEWTFYCGLWGHNRPCPENVRHIEEGRKADYDVALAHSPWQFYDVKKSLENAGAKVPIVFVCHVALVPHHEQHGFDGRSYEQFLTDLEDHVVICVSHFMIPQWRFRSKKMLTIIPHFLPEEIVGPPVWKGGGASFVNVVNNFYQPNRGVGAEFWSRLTVKRHLYGGLNRDTDAGQLDSFEEFRNAMRDPLGFLWCADNAAISFAPLEASALGVPLIAPRNADWPIIISHGLTGMLYELGNVEECQAVCREVAENKSLASTLSENGARSSRALFNRAAFRRGWLGALEAAMSS